MGLVAASIMVCATSEIGMCLVVTSIVLIIYNSLFQVMFSVLGSIVFFGEMLEVCTNSGSTYFIYFMYTILIASMALAPLNVIVAACFRKRNRNYEKPAEAE